MKAKEGGIVKINKISLYSLFWYFMRKYPTCISIFLLAGFMYALSNVGNIYINTIFLDLITNLYGNPDIMDKVLTCGILFLIIFLSESVFCVIFNYMYQSMDYRINDELKKAIFMKINKIDPLNFENPFYQDLIEKAKNGSTAFYMLFMTILAMGCFYIPYLIMLGLFMYYLDPLLIILLVIMFFPSLYLQIRRYSASSKFSDDSVPYKRKYEYFANCIGDRRYCKETRFWGANNFFIEKFIDALRKYTTLGWKFDKKNIGINLKSRLCSWLGFVLIISSLFFLLYSNRISISVFAALFLSIRNISDLINEIVVSHMGSAMEEYGLVNKLIEFLRVPEEDRENKSKDLLRLEGVSFKYPQSEMQILSNIDLQIRKGDRIAIVGENGSGKTTLVKILLGLYVPTEGFVQTFPKECVSAVFQDFYKYKMTLEDNVKISDLKKCISEREFLEYLRDSGLRRKELVDNIHTPLGKEFGGIDLSGGEWQRIAITRGRYKESELLILDEPTAAIDPIEENEVIQLLNQISIGRTVIFITHRMSIVKYVDKIIVMSQGKIVEVGSFHELLKKDGLFRQLYNEQSKWYQTE